MENTNGKIVTVSFLAGSVLIGFVISVIFDHVAAVATGPFGRMMGGDFVRHVLPVLLGTALFAFLQFSKVAHGWADEVVSEIRKVVWPSRRDTMAMTAVVCVMVVISGIFLGLLDVASGSVVDWLVHLEIFK